MKIYLYVKEHQITKLKYFGKTTTKDPYVYLGSGLYWRRHLKIYGNCVNTLSVWEFNNEGECEKFALSFSEHNNIVESKEWANMRPENGKDGKLPGSPGMKKEKNPNWGKTKEQNSFYGRQHKPETLELYRKQKAGGNNPRAKKLTTPIGKFSTIKEACKALHTSRQTLKEKLNLQSPGYAWGW